MREIKFRAFDLQTNKMYQWNEFRIKTKQGGWSFIFPNQSPKGLKYVKLIQYTGLKDKNGKEIYEGDILFNQEGMGDRWICEFKDGAFFFRLPLRGDMEDHIEYAHVPKGFKVIGNIYKNPELIKQ